MFFVECSRKRANWPYMSMLNDDNVAVRGFLGICMTRKVLGSLSEVLRYSPKPTKMITEQENNFWKDCEKRYSPIKLLKDTFERIKLNKIEHSNL